MSRLDENELRSLFETIEAPPGLDRWRERIADVHPEACDRIPDDDEEPEPDDDEEETGSATIVTLPTGGELRPRRQRKRSVAVAAAAAVVVGLGGIVVTSQLLNETPPADPTMIIDGPDKTITSPPSTSNTAPDSRAQSVPPPESGAGQSNSNGEPNTQPNSPADGGTTPADEPTWSTMIGDPTSGNTGVPLGATLGDHYGDLRITTAGQVVSDLRVNGSVIVDAPNVTLKRVLIVAAYGSPAVRQNASGLTVVDSELTGGSSFLQIASGLTVRRSRLEAGVTITSGAQLFDSYLADADVLIPAGSNTILLRHNTMGGVTMNDPNSPIRGVTIENNLLDQVDFPTESGSASIHVLGNRFRSSAPSTGWDPAATDYQWSNNTFADSGAPAQP